MPETTRKLTAVMFTDIVGYTVLMSKDERKALQVLQRNLDTLKRCVKKFNGDWLKEMGDGTLSSFASAVDAVNCAMDIQHRLMDDPDLTVRIGIHIGDVVVKEGDIYGDGVNVASRIEPLAEPGGICITERIYDDIRNRPNIETTFLGEKSLKNVDRPIKVYAITGEVLPAPSVEPKEPEAEIEKKVPPVEVPEKKPIRLWVGYALSVVITAILLIFVVWMIVERGSAPSEGLVETGIREKGIAVLPFDNFSDRMDDEFFSDGITDDIITQLSKIKDLHVISRTSTKQYKNTDKSPRLIGEELGVVNLLEGSVRPLWQSGPYLGTAD